VRLVEVAKEYGADAAYLVDYAEHIDPAWLEGVEVVGVTSGASVPDELVTDVLSRLAERGFGEVEEVEPVTEKMRFALPPEIRKVQRA
jgi:4-hydroxy-3-methylbut-2-enyl diphosphate reductase